MDFNLQSILTEEKVSFDNLDYTKKLYSLLYEDFFGPLRRDLIKLKAGQKNFKNLLHHGQVQVVNKDVVKDSVIFQLKQISETQTDKFYKILPGTLVILCNSSEKIYEKNIFLCVTFNNPNESHADTIFISDINESFPVGETLYQFFEYSVYFEAYRHSLHRLSVLQCPPLEKIIYQHSLEELFVPIFKEDNIIFKKSEKKFSAILGISELYKKLHENEQNHNNESSLLNLHDQNSWKDTPFDDSQQKAILQSLTSKVSIIQGPPGTGKSYVGSQIVKIFLNNKLLLANKISLPILVLCYTNSALDQFLELIYSETQKVIRIGSRSSSERLENHNLRIIRKYLSENMLRKQSFYEQEKDLMIQYKNTKKKIIDSVPSEADLLLFKQINLKLAELQRYEDLSVCKKVDIIGLTVTGAAKHKELLELIKPSIVLVEEAAQILESHLVASLPTSTKHLIMIGDHLQLRPSTNNYDLLLKQPLFGVSLFEQLIQNGFPFTCLKLQHRMAANISALVKPVYPDLVNHHSVQSRLKLPVIDRNVLFFTHNVPESSNQDFSSKTNHFEAEMIVNLSLFLLKFGIRASDIVILAAYSGQLMLIRKLLDKEGVKIETDTIDNYQGEEKEIVLLSLVRSGSSSIGFLSQDNRTTVALSRAKRGLLIIGNIDTLCQQSTLWTKVKQILEKQSSLVDKIEFKCTIHDNVISISQPEHFSLSPLGGCNNQCGYIMTCGHICHLKCHTSSLRHVCDQPCAKMCLNNLHKCQKKCDELCGLCQELVEIQLSCGHNVSVACHIRKETIVCSNEIEYFLDCGHSLSVKCGSKIDFNMTCSRQCDAILECGHMCNLKCHNDENHQQLCQEACNKTICDKGHPCPKKCHEKCPPCQVEVMVTLPCSHEEKMLCSENIADAECSKKCLRVLDCGHQCKGLCSEPCGPCPVRLDKVIRYCGHVYTGRCDNMNTCTQPCEKVLPCGHPCQEVCSSPCTSLCQIPVSSSGIKSSCNHVAMIPCHLASNSDNMNNNNSPSLCQERCESVLKCGHTCPAPCYQCSSGKDKIGSLGIKSRYQFRTCKLGFNLAEH